MRASEREVVVIDFNFQVPTINKQTNPFPQQRNTHQTARIKRWRIRSRRHQDPPRTSSRILSTPTRCGSNRRRFSPPTSTPNPTSRSSEPSSPSTRSAPSLTATSPPSTTSSSTSSTATTPISSTSAPSSSTSTLSS